MELRQETALKPALSQKMLQGLSVLQMGTQELKEYLDAEVLENPVIEMEETDGDRERRDKEALLHWLEAEDSQNRVYYQEEREENRELPSAEEISLEDYLLEQLLYMRIEKGDVRILRYMIQNLDERGYYTEAYEETARILGSDLEDVERAAKILKAMEPAGVGAADLRECLLIQLDAKGEKGLARTIADRYLEAFGKNQLGLIAKKEREDLEEVKKACELIKNLNPRPSNSFSVRRFKEYLIPDILIVKLKDYFEVLVNDAYCPRLRISRYYVDLLNETENQEAVRYIKDKLDSARKIQACVDQRRDTLQELGALILKRQIDFFKNGREFLKPLTQKEAAQEMEVSPSTVSRAVKDKYLQCPWGTYPLSFFFSVGGSETEGAKETPESIKACIQKFIQEENKKKPYSDRILTEKLRETGISISRRTVAKYREALGIGDALSRKVF